MKNILNFCFIIFIIVLTVFFCFDLYEIINLYKDINFGKVFFYSNVAFELYNTIILVCTIEAVLAFFIIFSILVKNRLYIVWFLNFSKNKQQNTTQIKSIGDNNKTIFSTLANYRKTIIFLVISVLLMFILVFSVTQIHTYIKEAYILKANIDKEGMIFILSNDISNILSKVLFVEISTYIMCCGAFFRLLFKKFQSQISKNEISNNN